MIEKLINAIINQVIWLNANGYDDTFEDVVNDIIEYLGDNT